MSRIESKMLNGTGLNAEDFLKWDGTKIVGATVAAAVVIPAENNFRLTTESTTPISTSDRIGQGTLYLTPFKGNVIWLYSGTAWVRQTSNEVSLTLSFLNDATNYDVFAYWSGSAVVLELSGPWTNNTTRADAITRQDGVWVKTSATTRRYVGTIRTTGIGSTEDSEAKRFVWNVENRARRSFKVIDATDSWTYSTALTWRQANASSANQIAFVVGLNEDLIVAQVAGTCSGPAGHIGCVGVGLDRTTGNDAAVTQPRHGASSIFHAVSATYRGFSGIGYHYLAWLELVESANTFTFIGDNGVSPGPQNGMSGEVMG